MDKNIARWKDSTIDPSFTEFGLVVNGTIDLSEEYVNRFPSRDDVPEFKNSNCIIRIKDMQGNILAEITEEGHCNYRIEYEEAEAGLQYEVTVTCCDHEETIGQGTCASQSKSIREVYETLSGSFTERVPFDIFQSFTEKLEINQTESPTFDSNKQRPCIVDFLGKKWWLNDHNNWEDENGTIL